MELHHHAPKIILLILLLRASLDNQYIYKNLVKQLRDAKRKRQVIIATHSATLVTNTKAEQVCVMLSDGAHGWIDIRGFTGESNIKKNIINYLEGGAESFRHKSFVYSDVLRENERLSSECRLSQE